METIKDLSSLTDEIFIQALRDILDEHFYRERPLKSNISIDPSVRKQLVELLQSSNPAELNISVNLPENLKKIYSKFVHDYRRDLEEYQIRRATNHFDRYRLNDFDWNVALAVHDEHIFKCRLPLTNLQLQLTNEKQNKNVLLELDEKELNRLIEEMSKIEQAINDTPKNELRS